MFPATPTPFPTPSAPPLDLPPLSAWDFAPTAIQYWNMASVITFGFQVLIVIAIVYYLVIKLFQMGKYLSRSDG